jgi:sugar phosphate isomerase/epimerase
MLMQGSGHMQIDSLSRRGFIGGVAGVAAAASLPGLTFGKEGGAWKMRLSTSSIQFSSLKIEDACARIAELGFDAIDIWSPFGKCRHLTEVVDRLGADGLVEVLKKNDLKLNAFSVYAGGYKRYAELLGQVGGGVAVRGSSGACKPEELTGRMTKYIESLKPLVELAEKNNSYLAIENHGNALLHSLDSFKAFVDINDNPRLGIALAPYHLQNIKASIPDAIRTAGDQLFFFYAWQKAPGVKQLPGLGPVDCTPWLQALADIRYTRYVNPFMHHEPEPGAMSEALKKSREYLLECHRKAIE